MRPIIAFNLICVPDQGAYKECSAHFAHLPDSYLKKFTEVAALEPLANFNLMALVYFPSSGAFIDAWSDPEIVEKAFPMREKLRAGGFEYLWIGCKVHQDPEDSS